MLKNALFAALLFSTAAAAEEAVRPPPLPQQDLPASEGLQTAVFAGGCFWGMQGVFQHVKGVHDVTAGYSGGAAVTAHYERVEWGDTGHAEAVRMHFDPREISYGRLLQVFFSVIDPTSFNRQGPDQGLQYRSEIFAADPAQQRTASAYIDQLARSHVFAHPIVTRVSSLSGFYPAESYHQDYLVKHPDAPYIVINDQPKIEKLKRLYPDLYRPNPITMARR